jgi:hypothetical protein
VTKVDFVSRLLAIKGIDRLGSADYGHAHYEHLSLVIDQ